MSMNTFREAPPRQAAMARLRAAQAAKQTKGKGKGRTSSQASISSSSEPAEEDSESEETTSGVPNPTSRTPVPRLREASVILVTPQSSLLKGQRQYVEIEPYKAQLEKERKWIASQLAQSHHSRNLYEALQAAGKTVKDDLFKLANGAYTNDPNSLVHVRGLRKPASNKQPLFNPSGDEEDYRKRLRGAGNPTQQSPGGDGPSTSASNTTTPKKVTNATQNAHHKSKATTSKGSADKSSPDDPPPDPKPVPSSRIPPPRAAKNKAQQEISAKNTGSSSNSTRPRQPRREPTPPPANSREPSPDTREGVHEDQPSLISKEEAKAIDARYHFLANAILDDSHRPSTLRPYLQDPKDPFFGLFHSPYIFPPVALFPLSNYAAAAFDHALPYARLRELLPQGFYAYHTMMTWFHHLKAETRWTVADTKNMLPCLEVVANVLKQSAKVLHASGAGSTAHHVESTSNPDAEPQSTIEPVHDVNDTQTLSLDDILDLGPTSHPHLVDDTLDGGPLTNDLEMSPSPLVEEAVENLPASARELLDSIAAIELTIPWREPSAEHIGCHPTWTKMIFSKT
ncbi:uncharacterized protein MELLADRAFT_85850 [Melampsora larici-populina 98AG31]|uniref:Uncharacterized protein n=1 Tax=Melampsora larici-populina (strain 98AG31 / pathotype 3-4-7) TaxID=747676 RepID=F4SDD0_MELLP|nr:uncharacterized protein MELLADRAFT_85850 [Melampsora larici-populina 98AG31]EGF97344.1 hypothetical protein MELLADRAFT_85850 [Melampsora larici-populina 98AG31]